MVGIEFQPAPDICHIGTHRLEISLDLGNVGFQPGNARFHAIICAIAVAQVQDDLSRRLALHHDKCIFANVGFGERSDGGRRVPCPASKKIFVPRQSSNAVQVELCGPCQPHLIVVRLILHNKINGLSPNNLQGFGAECDIASIRTRGFALKYP